MSIQPHGRELRKGRVSIPGQIYIVTTVTCNRQPLFSDFVCGRIVVSAMRHQAGIYQADSLAYVVMPDHVHWLLAIGKQIALSTVIGTFKSRSARLLNRTINSSTQTVWQRGFHDHALRREEDIKAVARYIIANPLRAGLVKSTGDYPLWDAAWL